MNWPRKMPKFSFLISSFIFWFTFGCGVKGDPVPPDKPSEIGRGRPTYKRATEGIKLERKRPGPRVSEDEDEREEEDEQE